MEAIENRNSASARWSFQHELAPGKRGNRAHILTICREKHCTGACSTALRTPHELSDARCELGPQTRWQVMSHSFDQDKFCARNGFSGRSAAAHVAHAVSEAMDHEGGDLEMSQAFGPIAGGYRRDRLTSDADRIVGAVVGAACPRGDFRSRRPDIQASRRRA